MAEFTLVFRDISLVLLPEVGGKNAPQGEMFRKLPGQGVRVPDGFATRARAMVEIPGNVPLEEEFARVVESGIDSISFTPDALWKGIGNIVAAEKEFHP